MNWNYFQSPSSLLWKNAIWFIWKLSISSFQDDFSESNWDIKLCERSVSFYQFSIFPLLCFFSLIEKKVKKFIRKVLSCIKFEERERGGERDRVLTIRISMVILELFQAGPVVLLLLRCCAVISPNEMAKQHPRMAHSSPTGTKNHKLSDYQIFQNMQQGRGW